MARELTASQKAYLFGLITVVLWSTIATALKLTLRHIDQYQMLFVATLTSTLFLGTVLAFQRRLIDTLRGLGEYWRLSLAQGVLNPLVYYLILFSAYDLLPAQVAQPINYTWAITLMLLSVLILKQRPTRADYISAMICYSGVLVISLQGGSGGFSIANPVGVALALLSTIIWALYWILNMRDQRDSLVTLFSGFLFSLPLVILVTVLLSSIEALPFEGIVGGVYIGLFEMGVAFLCWSLALGFAPNTSRVGNLIFLAPFLSLILVHYILGESIYSTTWVGLLLIIAGLVFQKLREKENL